MLASLCWGTVLATSTSQRPLSSLTSTPISAYLSAFTPFEPIYRILELLFSMEEYQRVSSPALSIPNETILLMKALIYLQLVVNDSPAVVRPLVPRCLGLAWRQRALSTTAQVTLAARSTAFTLFTSSKKCHRWIWSCVLLAVLGQSTLDDPSYVKYSFSCLVYFIRLLAPKNSSKCLQVLGKTTVCRSARNVDWSAPSLGVFNF